MRANVLLNLLKELRKSNKMRIAEHFTAFFVTRVFGEKMVRIFNILCSIVRRLLHNITT